MSLVINISGPVAANNAPTALGLPIVSSETEAGDIVAEETVATFPTIPDLTTFERSGYFVSIFTDFGVDITFTTNLGIELAPLLLRPNEGLAVAALLFVPVGTLTVDAIAAA